MSKIHTNDSKFKEFFVKIIHEIRVVCYTICVQIHIIEDGNRIFRGGFIQKEKGFVE